MIRQSRISTAVLDVAYREAGPADGTSVILLHGFPYSGRGYREAADRLAAAGCRVLVPDLRGYSGTRFLSADTVRSGEQAALGQDVLDFMDALGIGKAVLAGYDWGGRAACIVAALWPERVRGLLTCAGYAIQNIAGAGKPASPEQESAYWYQYYFQLERGRRGLAENRREVCRLLWSQWSPTWAFDDVTFNEAMADLDNPDFVAVSIHSYRHRFANVAGDPRYAGIEARLATQPTIPVPTINLHGAVDGVNFAKDSEGHAKYFSGPYRRHVLDNVGHCPPQETPDMFAAAVLELCR